MHVSIVSGYRSLNNKVALWFLWLSQLRGVRRSKYRLTPGSLKTRQRQRSSVTTLKKRGFLHATITNGRAILEIALKEQVRSRRFYLSKRTALSLSYVASEYVMLCHVIVLCYVMSCSVM